MLRGEPREQILYERPDIGMSTGLVKLLAVDESPETIEDDWSWPGTVLIEFPSDAQARQLYQSDPYQTLARHRWAASDGNIVMIRGLGVPAP